MCAMWVLLLLACNGSCAVEMLPACPAASRGVTAKQQMHDLGVTDSV